jgi:hypothetical protein
MRGLRGQLRYGLLPALLVISFYALRAENKIPQYVIDTYNLLKKPVESLLPDLDEKPAQEHELAENEPLNLEDYQDLHNKRERWNEMRALIESGRPLFTPLPSEITISTVPTGRFAPAVPPPPGFTVQLPYESRLTVSGRKTIGMTYQSSSYVNSNYSTVQGIPSTTSSFQIQQQLQVRINGQIGRKVTVNVDFDDTKEDKKDISIVYKGDPDELVQRAAFGDITLSLPATEFAGYTKQLFGASLEMKYKALHAYAIASRTKGQSETKEFTGNVIIQRLNVLDTSYVRHKYYNLTKLNGASGDVPIPLATLQVYLDNRDITRVSFTLSSTTVSGSLLTTPSGPVPDYNGNFVLLSPGIDYSFDPFLGVITLRNPVQSNAVIAVTYRTAAGVTRTLQMIKFDETSIPQIPQTEDLTHYSFGVAPIVRDDGQGSFTMQVQDLNGVNVGPQLGINYLPNNSGQIFVDFVNGTFNLVNKLLPTADIYTVTPNHHFTFFTEFRSRIKTYTLRPNIVINSERIALNGRILTRDVDYFIDYASGFITFFNPDQITEDSRVQATYDYSPFGIAGAQQDTLVGERTELSFYPIAPVLSQSLIGQTILYDFAPKSTAAPDIRQTAGSFLLTESDLHFKDLIFNPLPFLKSSFGAEVAKSANNPNTFGKAIIDNMEGIKDETTVGLSIQSWEIASNPTTSAAFATALYSGLGNELLPTLTVNPNASALPGDQQQVLDMTYDLRTSTEASVVSVLSPSGVDMSRKLFLEMYVQGDGTGSGTQMNITLGQINEDADGTHGGAFTDIHTTHPLGDGAPRTEDINYNNTLDVGEDVGWSYRNPDSSVVQIGPNNLRLDSEDLDRNGLLDAGQPTRDVAGASGVGGELGYASTQGSTFDAGPGANRVDYTGWKFIRIPLNISSATATQQWSAIKEIRVSLKAPVGGFVGGAGRGIVKIGKISVVGNKWQSQTSTVAGSTVNVFAISNETDATYSSPAGNADFDDLNQVNGLISGPQPQKRREQALAFDYFFDATTAGSSVTAISVSATPMDFTTYGSIRMFVHGDGKGETFFFRAGSDADYWEFHTNVTWSGWQEIRIDQVDTSGTQRSNAWVADTLNPGTNIGTTFKGHPNLALVSQLKVGVINNSAAANSGELWIDEIHAADSITRKGYAGKVNGDFEVLGWAKFGAVIRDIDANFQTFQSAITNQARHEAKEYLNFTRLPWFPMNFSAGQTRTQTPNIQQIGNSSLVSVLQQGRVDENNFTSNGTLQVPNWPKLGLLYDTDKMKTSDLFRTDKTDHYGTTFDYTVPLQKAWLPRTISAGYKRTDHKLSFEAQNALNSGTVTDPFSISDTKDITNDASLKLAFQPMNGFTFNPNISRSTTRESKQALLVDTATLTNGSPTITGMVPLEYDRQRTQTMGFDSTLGIKRWFAPRVRYTVTNSENYGIPLATDQTAAMFKTVDRTSTGEFDWDFAWRDFSRKVPMLQSMTVSSSYLVEDGDSWNQVASGYDTLNTFTIRKSLSPGNIEATRQNLTLRDTMRSTQRLNPFDWKTNWTGARIPLRTLSLTSTLTQTNQRQETTGTPSKIITKIYPDIVMSMTQTEYFFNAARVMSNSQLNLRTQYKTVDTENTSLEKVNTNGGDWRFTLWRKLDVFMTYTRTTDTTFDRVNNVTSNDGLTEALGLQFGFNLGRWRFTPKYDQTKQKAVGATGLPSLDLITRIPALQIYADLFLPAGLKLPFSDLIVFSNRIRTTNTLSLTQKRSSLNELTNNSDTYQFTTSEDYEITSNIRLTVGGAYSYQVNKVSSDANFYSYQFNSLLTIQF